MEPFGYCLNTSTLKTFDLEVVAQVDVAAAAGYQGIEPWVRHVVAYLDAGGSLGDLRRRIEDAGLQVSGAIAFHKWAEADPGVRAEALEIARREMAMMAELGATKIASPPFGDVAAVTLDEMAERFVALDAVGRETGVKPVLEFWGFAAQLSRFSQALYVAAATGLGDVEILVDVYHMYKGGSPHAAISLLNGSAIGIVHMNDYPADPPRETIRDADRVLPGDGVAPMDAFLRGLYATGYRGMLSLEIFPDDLPGYDALGIAKEGLEKMRAAVLRAMS